MYLAAELFEFKGSFVKQGIDLLGNRVRHFGPVALGQLPKSCGKKLGLFHFHVMTVIVDQLAQRDFEVLHPLIGVLLGLRHTFNEIRRQLA